MMGKHKTRDEIWDGFADPLSAPAEKEAEKTAAAEAPEEPETPEASEPPAAVESDPGVLKDLSTRSIAETFGALSARAREYKESLAPTLAALKTLVELCQEAGLPQVGLQQADFDTLRELRLIKEGGAKEDSSSNLPDVHYALLCIDDARILVRVMPDHVIDCYNENINKPRSNPSYLDSSSFWNPAGAGYRRYDLSNDESRIDFVQTVLITAASTGALQEMREYDVAAKPAALPLQKPARGLGKKQP